MQVASLTVAMATRSCSFLEFHKKLLWHTLLFFQGPNHIFHSETSKAHLYDCNEIPLNGSKRVLNPEGNISEKYRSSFVEDGQNHSYTR